MNAPSNVATAPISRGIDHLVLCVHDLTVACARYRDMGFTLTPEARHPFGTANALVQLQGSFLELVSIADPALIPAHGQTTFSFAAFSRDFLKVHEGFAMLVLESSDARADHAEFAAAGLDVFDPFDFERKAKLPDGREVTVGFSLAFVGHRDMPQAMFFTCQQHAPQYFWKRDYQRHDNTATAVAEVILVADEPGQYGQFLHSFSGIGEVTRANGEISVTTARGQVSILDPATFTTRFGVAPPSLGFGPRLAAYKIEVADLSQLKSCLGAGSIPHREHGAMICVDATDAFGVTIGFCAG